MTFDLEYLTLCLSAADSVLTKLDEQFVTQNVTLTLDSTVLSSGSFTSTCMPSPDTDGT